MEDLFNKAQKETEKMLIRKYILTKRLCGGVDAYCLIVHTIIGMCSFLALQPQCYGVSTIVIADSLCSKNYYKKYCKI